MKSLQVEFTWRQTIMLEVPDDFEVWPCLDDWPDEVLEQVNSTGASLVDWN